MMSVSLQTNPTDLLDSEDVGEAFEIALLSGVEAKVLRYFICNSGIGGHL